MMDNDKWFGLAVAVVIISIIAFALAWVLPTHKASMTVRSAEWQYTVKELKDYQVWTCDTKYRTNCNGSGKDRQCRQESYQDCHWETRTRTHNTWITGGRWPIEPFWETNYIIRPGNYERRYESYTVQFSDDKELYPYHPGSLNEYYRFEPRQKFNVQLNLFEHITSVE